MYGISNFPSSVGSLDSNSGVLTLNPGQNKGNTYNYSIQVSINENGIVQKLETITGYLYLGYREPEIGDYAFGDGTFSNYPSDDKDLIGLVFQKEVITTGEEWKLGILSVDSISEVAGPDYYYWVNTGNNSGFSEYGLEQQNIYNYMKSSSGLNIAIMTNEPTAAGYLGFNPTDYIPTTKTVDYNYLTTRPKSLVSSGFDATQRLVEVGKNRLKTISANNTSFKSYLLTNGYLSNQGEFVNWPVYEKEPNTSEKDFSDLCDVLNTSIKNQGFNSAPYYKVIHPLAFKASLYEPKCLKDVKNQQGLNYYRKGNWYIPSVEELELLIWYRIRSTTAAVNAATSKSNWDANTYNSGSEIFSKTSESFTNFLNNSQMIASDVSSANDNYIYGEMMRDNLTTYGWFYEYHSDSYGWSYYQHQGCRRDQLYTITPCCTITVKKHS